MAGLTLLGLLIILLIVIAVLRNPQTARIATAPNPTQVVTNPQTALKQLTTEEKTHIDTIVRIEYGRLSADERARLENFKRELPFHSEVFDIEYVPAIGKYVIYMKDTAATTTLKNYLGTQRVEDIYVSGSNVFMFTREPIDVTVADFINALKDDTHHGEGANVQGVYAQAPNDPPPEYGVPKEEDFTKMFDWAKVATTFNFGGGVSETGAGVPATGGTTGTGGTANDAEFIKRAGAPNESGYYKMPPPTGTEYEISSCDGHHYGSIELLTLLNKVAFDWKAKYTDGSYLRIWDINATGHASHRNGVDVDIDISNLSAANMCSDFYSQPGTCGEGLNEGQCRSIELGKMFVSTNIVKMIFFDDPEVNARITAWARANGKDNLQVIEPWGTQACDAGHHDHFHVRVLDDYQKETWAAPC